MECAVSVLSLYLGKLVCPESNPYMHVYLHMQVVSALQYNCLIRLRYAYLEIRFVVDIQV